MKINKIFLMAGLAVMSLMATSCSDDDDYTAGKPAGSQDISFFNEYNPVLGLTDTQFEITLHRTNASGEQTVPLEVLQCADVLSCPTQATFASGDTLAHVTVAVSSEAKAFEEYILRVRIPEEYTNPYAPKMGTPQINLNVMKEDYKVLYQADFTSWFFEETWPIEIEYSEYLDLYRIKDLYVNGYNYYYKLGKKAEDGSIPMTMCSSDGVVTKEQACGYVHPTYGMISTTWLSDNFTGYDPGDDAYYIPFQWTVSAGSFGAGYESFKITAQ